MAEVAAPYESNWEYLYDELKRLETLDHHSPKASDSAEAGAGAQVRKSALPAPSPAQMHITFIAVEDCCDYGIAQN
jgi:hypothetical protein